MELRKSMYASGKDLQLASVPRDKYSTKRINGKIVIIGGSERFHGAPALASNAAYAVLAALRIGVGYAVEYVPKSVITATRSVSPDIIVMPLYSNNLTSKDIPRLIKDLQKSQCLVLGPGLGKDDATSKAVIKLIDYIKKTDKRAVIDADALYALGKYPRKLNMNFIITPNKEEFEFFYKGKIKDSDIKARIDAAIRVSKNLNANILFKGHESIVTDGKRVKIINSKSSALAVMGTGDTLAGMVGGFVTKNSDLFIATVAGTYLHAIIGDNLYKEKGNHILASDVVDLIPKILKKFDR